MNADRSFVRKGRRQYIVNRNFQFKFMAYMATAVFFGLLVLFLSNFYYYDLLIAEGLEIGLDETHPYFGFIQDQRILLIKVFLATSFFVYVLLIVFGVYLSHRIAGPIYRIEQYLMEVSAGKDHMRPVSLRKHDFFPEIAGIVNSTIEHFEKEQGATSTKHEN